MHKSDRPEGNILDAIKTAFADVEEFGQKFERMPSESTFMNKNRQTIFVHLCAHPCSTLMKIASDMKMSTTTVRWHLRQLVEKKFVSQAMAGARTVFYPTELVMPAHVELLARLNEPRPRQIMSAVIRSPGISQKDLCTALSIKHSTAVYDIAKLAKTGLLVAMKDGKFTRYYPSDALSKLRESGMRQVSQFRRNLLKMLRRDGVSPRIARTTYGELHIEVMRGQEKTMLILYTDPFVTVLT